MLHGVDYVAGAGLALGANHGRSLGNPPESLAQVARAADERRGKSVLVDVVRLVGGGQNLALVDKVHAQFLQNLRLGEVADASLGHHRDRNCLDDLLDEAWLGHAGHAALGADHGRHALQSHHRSGSGLLGNAGLLHVHHVHDDAALEHLRQTHLQAQTGSRQALVPILFRHAFHPQFTAACGHTNSAQKPSFLISLPV